MSAPRASQERPRPPKSAQERPKTRSRAHKDAPDSPRSTILRLRSHKKATFEDDHSRDSFEQRVRSDFRSKFTSCAQEWTCEKPTKTNEKQCFLHVLRMSPRLRASRCARADRLETSSQNYMNFAEICAFVRQNRTDRTNFDEILDF